MDCIDTALYDFPEDRWTTEELAEATRKAFCRLFDSSSDDAMLVMRYLIGVTHYGETISCNDGIFNSQNLVLKDLMMGIKKQLNMKPIELGDINE